MSTATATITYRKTKQGEWVAFGPLAAFKEQVITPGGVDTITVDSVVVTKRSGESKVERIRDIGRPFTVDGVQMVYGYIAQSPRSNRRPARSRCDSCRCHREPNAGRPGSILFDGCTRCGCEGDI